MVELCQVRSLAGGASKEMVLAFNKLRETYRIATDRDQNLDEVTERRHFWSEWKIEGDAKREHVCA